MRGIINELIQAVQLSEEIVTYLLIGLRNIFFIE